MSRTSRIIHSPAFTPVITGIASLGTGLVVGYFLGRKAGQLEEDPYEIPATVTQGNLSPEALALLAEKRKNGSVIQGSRPVRVILDDDDEDPEGTVVIAVVSEEVEVVEQRNVFAQDGSNWDMEAELKTRTPDAPYPLHKDEFYSEESGYRQYSYTYYPGDDILADEEEVVIHSYENRVGALLFGHGSDDPQVFYVRNDKSKEEYEITRLPDLYYMVEVRGLELEEVQGGEAELKHSMKMRSEE